MYVSPSHRYPSLQERGGERDAHENTGSICSSVSAGRWHLMVWPSATVRIGGTSISQRPPGTRDFQPQRVWNGQPDGGESAEGISPSSTTTRFLTFASASGIADSNASV